METGSTAALGTAGPVRVLKLVSKTNQTSSPTTAVTNTSLSSSTTTAVTNTTGAQVTVTSPASATIAPVIQAASVNNSGNGNTVITVVKPDNTGSIIEPEKTRAKKSPSPTQTQVFITLLIVIKFVWK